MKLDQVAYYARSNTAAEELKRVLGLDKSEWLEDFATAKNLFSDGRWGPSVGHLRFNYSQGIELEILTYDSGTHWHELVNPEWNTSKTFFLSHIGYHLEDSEPMPDMPLLLVQETVTEAHTSEYLTTGAGAGRKYHYRIYELALGNYIKLIKRIHPGAPR